MLVGAKKEYMIHVIESKAGVKFKRIGAPQPLDMAKASATLALESVKLVSDRWGEWGLGRGWGGNWGEVGEGG